MHDVVCVGFRRHPGVYHRHNRRVRRRRVVVVVVVVRVVVVYVLSGVSMCVVPGCDLRLFHFDFKDFGLKRRTNQCDRKTRGCCYN